MTPHVTPPSLPGPAVRAWHALFDFAAQQPTGWTVVGGQMAHLHAWERNTIGPRPTVDIDTGLAYRIGVDATATLRHLGFTSTVTSVGGPAVRWVRGDVEIDVLVPSNRGRPTHDVHGQRLLESHGIQQALDRSEPIALTVGGRTAVITRPRLYAAVIAKAAALRNVGDSRQDRHLDDLVILLGFLTDADIAREQPSKRDFQHLDLAHGKLVGDLTSPRNTPAVNAAFGILADHGPR